jgi:hypothetical protein
MRQRARAVRAGFITEPACLTYLLVDAANADRCCNGAGTLLKV